MIKSVTYVLGHPVLHVLYFLLKMKAGLRVLNGCDHWRLYKFHLKGELSNWIHKSKIFDNIQIFKLKYLELFLTK